MRTTRSFTSALVRTVWLARITPFWSIVTTTGFTSSAAGSSFFSLFGRLSAKVRVIIVVTIMKMMSTTSTTSTSGVMLMLGAGRFLESPEAAGVIPISNSLLLVAHFEQDAAEAHVLNHREQLPHVFVRGLVVELHHQRALRLRGVHGLHLGFQARPVDLLLVEDDRPVRADRELDRVHVLRLRVRAQ